MTGVGSASPLTTAVELPEASASPTMLVSRAAPSLAESSALVGASWSVPIPEKPPHPWRPPQVLCGLWTAPIPSAVSGSAMLG